MLMRIISKDLLQVGTSPRRLLQTIRFAPSDDKHEGRSLRAIKRDAGRIHSASMEDSAKGINSHSTVAWTAGRWIIVLATDSNGFEIRILRSRITTHNTIQIWRSLFKFAVTIQIRIMNSARGRLNHFTIQGTRPMQVWSGVAFEREYFIDAGWASEWLANINIDMSLSRLVKLVLSEYAYADEYF